MLFDKVHFNPRSREGSDLGVIGEGTNINISIHAPARGATGIGLFYVQFFTYFNPRSREGSDFQLYT